MTSQNILESLEQTFGKIPQVIRENLKYFSYNDESYDFTCTVCDKIIKLNEGNEYTTTKNFMKHLETNAHKSETMLETEIISELNLTFKNSIPKLIKSNVHILGTNGKHYYCEICEKTLEVSIYPSVTEANFAQHFLTDHHENSLKTYDENKSVLQEIYGGIPCTIFHNSQYLKLTRSGKNYSCFICEKVLKVDCDYLEKTEERFTEHFETEYHISNAEQERALLKIPLLEQIFGSSQIPQYVVKNIEYLSANQTNTALYCSFCNESFFFKQEDLKESEQSLQNHISSDDHQSELKERRNLDDCVFSKLHERFDEFPVNVVNNLDCLSTYEDDLICGICKVYIKEGASTDELKELIESHLQSSYHADKVKEQKNDKEDLLNDLKYLFGSIPEFIQDEMSHIVYQGGIDFQCTLCIKTLKACNNGDYEENTYRTEDNFYKHLNSNQHREKLEGLESLDEDLKTHIESIFSPSLPPYYVCNNLENLGYKDNDEDNNFFCFLCDWEIEIDCGPKSNELTAMNLSKHLLSFEHVNKLKNKAYNKYLTTAWLKSIFGGVSNLILNNIQHLEQYENHYRCKLCKAKILTGLNSETSRKNFYSHLNGEAHRSLLRYLEESREKAAQKLEDSFWIMPEYLLKNLDFVTVRDDDEIFCKSCQKPLSLDGVDDQTLRYHFESKGHEHNVGIY